MGKPWDSHLHLSKTVTCLSLSELIISLFPFARSLATPILHLPLSMCVCSLEEYTGDERRLNYPQFSKSLLNVSGAHSINVTRSLPKETPPNLRMFVCYSQIKVNVLIQERNRAQHTHIHHRYEKTHAQIFHLQKSDIPNETIIHTWTIKSHMQWLHVCAVFWKRVKSSTDWKERE